LIIPTTLLLSCLCLRDVASAAEFGDVELSAYALGAQPRDVNVFNQGTTVPSSIQDGFGAGFKVGLFPAALRRMVGLEMDSNVHGTALSFPNVAGGQNHGTGRSDLLIINTTFNAILRYPGETIRPYVGAGIGWSHGTLLNPNIAGRDDKDFDSARAFTHQFLGGAQVILSPHARLFNTQRTVAIYLFGAYRYLSSDYHWEGLAVDFRTHYGLVGAGLRF
jgi:opacity protein-like surface antigen